MERKITRADIYKLLNKRAAKQEAVRAQAVEIESVNVIEEIPTTIPGEPEVPAEEAAPAVLSDEAPVEEAPTEEPATKTTKKSTKKKTTTTETETESVPVEESIEQA